MPEKPYEAFVSEFQGPLPDALTSSIVNDRIRQAIERIEPGVHQFIPTVITLPNGQRDDEWWSMRPCHRVDAIAIDHCEDVYEYHPRPDQYPDWVYYRTNDNIKTKLVINKNAISGMAVWFDRKLRKEFFGEELGNHFIESGIRGYCLPCDELNRSSHVAEV